MKFVKKFLFLLRSLRNGEHFDFYWSIVDFIKGNNSIPPALTALWKNVVRLFDKEDDIYKRSLKSIETKFIQEADRKRDDSFMMLRRGVEFALYNEDPQIKNGAKTLMEVMDNYKDACRMPFGENTSLIINMIQDLRKPRYAGMVTLLGLTEAVSKLEENNAAFKEIYTERTLNINEQKVQGTMSDIRPQLDKAFFDFTDGLNALYKTNELLEKNAAMREQLGGMIDFINSYIGQYERIFARRNAKYKVGKPGGDGKDDMPETEIPGLLIAGQEILGQSDLPGMSDFGTMMSLVAADAELFRTTLYPIARGSVLRLTNEEEDTDFPVMDFLKDAADNIIGLLVEAPDPDTVFVKPFQGTHEQDAELLKDDEPIAVLEKVSYPVIMKNG
ncbi:MAG: DUF6261 family protein [Tannerellaceae bacterium]|jgi:hypothetical protein|nr:DUF6261 family protein [Tannerellaceae bacterium]